jgi:hypothetical protein
MGDSATTDNFVVAFFVATFFFLCNITVYRNVGTVTWVTLCRRTLIGDTGGDENG